MLVSSNQSNHLSFSYLTLNPMRLVPLSLNLYHVNTQTNKDYFSPNVFLSTPTLFTAKKTSQKLRGRVLLLVFPPPGRMGIDVLSSYVEGGKNENDTIIYVGEGRGGVNCNDAFFDELESGRWVVERRVEVEPFGDFGFEKMWVFRRRQEEEKTNIEQNR